MIAALTTLAPAITGVAKLPVEQSRPASAAGFAEALGNAAREVSERLQAAEDVSFRALTGEATARETVDAVLAAERTLQVAIAVRDKAVSAWLEISRMAI